MFCSQLTKDSFKIPQQNKQKNKINKQLYYQNTVAVTFGCGKNQVKNLLQISLANLNFVHWQTTESAICLVMDNTRGNLLHGLWFLISSKGSFTCTIPQKGKIYTIPFVFVEH